MITKEQEGFDGVPEEELEQGFNFIPDTDGEENEQEEPKNEQESTISPEAYQKLAEELKAAKQLLDTREEVKGISQQQQAMLEQLAKQKQQEDVPPQEQAPAVPPKPEAPKRPSNFSQQEAFSDPTSESAKYIFEKMEYQDRLAEWQTQLTAFVAQHYEDKIQGITSNFSNAIKEQEENLKRKQIYDNAVGTLTRKHGLTYDEATEFIKKMEDPKSVTLEDLVAIYRHQKGDSEKVPSEEFVQTRRAQNFTTPMSMQNNQRGEGVPQENSILRKLISEQNKASKLFD